MSETVLEAVAYRQIGSNEFESVNKVEWNGPAPEILGYGGFCMAFGINAAAATRLAPQQDDFLVYSVTGYFTAASVTTQIVRAQITTVRDSRTFATRRIEVYQTKDDKPVMIMTMVVDFQKPEPESMLVFSTPAFKQYTPPEKSITEDEHKMRSLPPNATEKDRTRLRRQLMHMLRKFDRRIPRLEISPEGQSPTQRDQGGDIPRKTFCHYYKNLKHIDSHLAHVLSIAYLADAGSPYIAASFSQTPLTKIAAAASLDFALRILTNNLDLNRWMMREEHAVAGRDGRTYTEARMFDEDGGMIATMSQQCLLRPKSKKTVGPKPPSKM